jgi:hypothetical protein
MSHSFYVRVYPSQLIAFKSKSKQLANAIAETANGVRLSAFIRNDLLAVGLGYKGHSDLHQQAQKIKQADPGHPLFLFTDPIVREKTQKAFCQHLPFLSSDAVALIIASLSYREQAISMLAAPLTTPMGNEVFLQPGTPARARLNGYFIALAGLKKQAGVASQALTHRTLQTDREALGGAQKLMSENIRAVNHIIRILGELKTTVVDLTHEQLKAWLFKYDLHFSHLRDKPFYYVMLKEVAGKEYFFLSQYFGDGDGCAGHSISLEEAREIMFENMSIKVLPHQPVEHTFISALAMPELCSDVYRSHEIDERT